MYRQILGLLVLFVLLGISNVLAITPLFESSADYPVGIQPFVVTDQLLSGSNGRLSFEGSHVLSEGHLRLEDGEVDADDTIYVEGTANVSGRGTIIAVLENNGNVGSGSSADELVLEGDYVQTSVGTLHTGIRGTTPLSDYNRLTVHGHAHLDGPLSVSFLDGFGPLEPDTFRVLNYASYSGVFSDYLGFDPTELIPTYDDTSLVLAHVTTPPEFAPP